MLSLNPSSNYVVARNMKEVRIAKQKGLCRFIILETPTAITIWNYVAGNWDIEQFILTNDFCPQPLELTGLDAYRAFYSYCGRDEIERMKSIYTPIPSWEAEPPFHYCNLNYVDMKLYQPIYELDANSAFTYGTTRLPDDFNLLKQYMTMLYGRKRDTTSKTQRSLYKALMNYLIGYMARVKGFSGVRSHIIAESNLNIKRHMVDIQAAGGTVFLSNTDSIVTDEKGMSAMQDSIGAEVGQFKVQSTSDKLYYKSSNAYQLGDNVTYSGVGYYARKHTDFFKGEYAVQTGKFIIPKDIDWEDEEGSLCHLSSVEWDRICVTVFYLNGEYKKRFYYRLGGDKSA